MNRYLNMTNTAAGAKRACTNCGRCKTACPADIDIPAIIGSYRRYEKEGWAVTETLTETAGPEDCIECGACTACCPEKIAVKDIIRELAMQQCQYCSHPPYAGALK